MAFVIVVAAALGPSLSDGDDFVARWLRRGRASVLEDRARPPLPPPSRPMRLSDLFGRGADGSGVTLPSPDERDSTGGRTGDTGAQS
jgi:hypothetical protein